jgi:tetratricopeptide (TPR) repeat protein
MNNNNDYTEKLVRYLDGELNTAEAQALQTELEHNIVMQQEMDNLLFTKTVIKNYGLTQKVSSIHQAMMEGSRLQKHTTKPPVRSLVKMTMRFAAGIILLVGLFGLYQYLTVTPGNLYNEQYTPYQEGTMRGTTGTGVIEKAYGEKKYDAVIILYNQATSPSAHEAFLTAQAYLNTNNYSNAIALFNAVIEKNKISNTGTLNDDAEYYLALSYLKNRETEKAMSLFEKIHNDKDHLYHNRVSSWYLAKLKLLNWKN